LTFYPFKYCPSNNIFLQLETAAESSWGQSLSQGVLVMATTREAQGKPKTVTEVTRLPRQVTGIGIGPKHTQEIFDKLEP
jgi:hypothetical protein